MGFELLDKFVFLKARSLTQEGGADLTAQNLFNAKKAIDVEWLSISWPEKKKIGLGGEVIKVEGVVEYQALYVYSYPIDG